jgi:hypothetical protein
MAIQSSASHHAPLAQLTARLGATQETRFVQLLSIAAVVLFLFVGAARAQQNSEPCTLGSSYCLFISDFANGTVQLWRDDGMTGKKDFVKAGGGGEGVSCLSGSSNVMYLANNTPFVHVADLTTGNLLGMTSSLGGAIESLNANSAGTVLYLSQFNGPFKILGMAPVLPPLSPWLTPLYSVSTNNSHDSSVGPNGNVFATGLQNPQTGVEEYDPTLTNFLGQFLPTTNSSCAVFAGAGTQCWYNLSGMAWDAQGNLWVSSDRSGLNGIFEFDPLGRPLNFTSDPKISGIDPKPIGLTVAPLTDPSNAGYIIVANNATAGVNGNVIKIDPHCTGTVTAPGTCTQSTFISADAFGGRPKYPVYYSGCPNPDLNGHVEICKLSDPSHPVTGTFEFTATAPFFSSGDLKVPVGYCSGPVEVPAADPRGVVTVTEKPVLGDLVSNVTAYSYDQYGFKIDELKSWTLPELHADVYVVPGNIDLETVATFTNYAAPKGQLKICKIAGKDVPIGTLFTFTVQTPGLFGEPYVIPAGPADQGGYCQLAGTYAANTPLLVWEQPFLNDPHYQVSNITVSPADRGSNYDYTLQSVIATIADGITEVDFTNTAKATTAQCPLAGGLYSDGPVNAGLGAFPINFGILTSDSFGLGSSGTTVTGFCFAAWLYPGDTMESVDWSITSGELNSGSLYGSGKATAGSNLSCTLSCSANQIIGPPQFPPPSNRACGVALSGKPSGAFNVYACTVSNLNVAALTSGTTLWLNLQNATVPSGDPVFWDQNNGVGFSGYGGPSSAFDALDGPILPESFVIYGH